ncbi:hypothetical protein [Rubrobacter indicoceani]|uniref:hypothetical protein n=1 Tax=Rubrobacter indicoceani TaxID=2051957 RepID=UPI000E5A8663|nr:hypothetical protein [Rubrobacter indicoceani]
MESTNAVSFEASVSRIAAGILEFTGAGGIIGGAVGYFAGDAVVGVQFGAIVGLAAGVGRYNSLHLMASHLYRSSAYGGFDGDGDGAC